MTDIDPFMAAANTGVTQRPGDFKRDSKGTPFVSDPTGATVKPKRKTDPPRVKTVRYSRPSGYGDQIENSYNLTKWGERQILLGITLGIGEEGVTRARALLPANQEDKAWRTEADSIVKLAKDIAKAGLAADRGNHAHAITEDSDKDRDWITRAEHGEDLGITHHAQAALIDAWNLMLDEYGLEVLAAELPVVHDGYRCAGTLDRIVRLTRDLIFNLPDGRQVSLRAGTIVVLDIKSGRLRHENGTVVFWRGHPIQIAIYAGAVPYNTDTDTRLEHPYEIDQSWALIAHLDVLAAIDGQAACSLIAVDIEAGRRGADLVQAAKAYETDDAMFSLADTHTVTAPVAQPAGDSPTTTAGDEPRAAQHTIEERVTNLRERCRVVTNLHPNGSDYLKINFAAANLDLRALDLNDDDIRAATMIVEAAETAVTAPWADLPPDPMPWQPTLLPSHQTA